MPYISAFPMPEFISAALMIVPIIGLAVIAASECLQTTARYYGAKEKRVASGYNGAMKVMVWARFISVAYLFSCGLNVDRGEGPFILIFISITGIMISSLIMHTMAQRFYKKELAATNIATPLRFRVTAVAANSFNYLGITAPFVMASMLPDYRLTLANSSFLFNSFFTVINVYYLESVIARAADTNPRQMAGYAHAVIASRVVACAVVAVIYTSGAAALYMVGNL